MQIFNTLIVLTFLLSHLPVLNATNTTNINLQPSATQTVSGPRATADFYGGPYTVARVRSVLKAAMSEHLICSAYIEKIQASTGLRIMRMRMAQGECTNPYSLRRGPRWLQGLEEMALQVSVRWYAGQTWIELSDLLMKDSAAKAVAAADSGDSRAARLKVQSCIQTRARVRSATWEYTIQFWKARSLVGALFRGGGEPREAYLSLERSTRADRRWDEPAERAKVEERLARMGFGPNVEKADIPPWQSVWPPVRRMWRDYMDEWLQLGELSRDNADDVEEIAAIENVPSNQRTPWELIPPPLDYPRLHPDSRSWSRTAAYNYDGSARSNT